LSALGFHPAAKSVRLRAATPIGLKRTLRHETLLLLSREKLALGEWQVYLTAAVSG
jgi:hypothetical protein